MIYFLLFNLFFMSIFNGIKIKEVPKNFKNEYLKLTNEEKVIFNKLIHKEEQQRETFYNFFQKIFEEYYEKFTFYTNYFCKEYLNIESVLKSSNKNSKDYKKKQEAYEEIKKIRYYFEKTSCFIHEFHHAIEFFSQIKNVKNSKYNSYIYIKNKNISTSDETKQIYSYKLSGKFKIELYYNVLINEKLAGCASEIIYLKYYYNKIEELSKKNQYIKNVINIPHFLNEIFISSKSDFIKVFEGLLYLKKNHMSDYKKLCKDLEERNFKDEIWYKNITELNIIIAQELKSKYNLSCDDKKELSSIICSIFDSLIKKYSEVDRLSKMLNILSENKIIVEKEFFDQSEILNLYFSEDEINFFSNFTFDMDWILCIKKELIEKNALNSLKLENLFSLYSNIISQYYLIKSNLF